MSSSLVVAEERAAVERDPLDIGNLLLREAGIHLPGQFEHVFRHCFGLDRQPDMLPIPERNLRFLQQAELPILENSVQSLRHTHHLQHESMLSADYTALH